MNADERSLLKHFRALPEAQQRSLLDYAEFLASRETLPAEAVPTSPLDIPRPEKESVVAAIKRLRKTYPMLDPDALLDQTSGLMMQHMIHGRAAPEVIDELEALFARRYRETRP